MRQSQRWSTCSKDQRCRGPARVGERQPQSVPKPRYSLFSWQRRVLSDALLTSLVPVDSLYPLVTFVCTLVLTWHHKTMQRRLEWCREMQRSLAAGRGHRFIGKGHLSAQTRSILLLECSWLSRYIFQFHTSCNSAVDCEDTFAVGCSRLFPVFRLDFRVLPTSSLSDSIKSTMLGIVGRRFSSLAQRRFFAEFAYLHCSWVLKVGRHGGQRLGGAAGRASGVSQPKRGQSRHIVLLPFPSCLAQCSDLHSLDITSTVAAISQ